LKEVALRWAYCGLAACFFFVTAAPSFANVVGDLQIGGNGVVTITPNGLQFNLNDTTHFSTEVGVGSDITFAGCATGVLGSPGCLTDGEGVDINGGAKVIGGTTPDFITFQSQPDLVYNLTSLDPGSSNTHCAVSPCSVTAGSPIILVATPDGGTDALLGVEGFVSDDGFDTESPYVGHFVAVIAGLDPAQVQAQFVADKSFTHTYAGDLVVDASAVPEPRPIWIAGLAGIFLMLFEKYRKRRKTA
jgi:hypothetical protein